MLRWLEVGAPETIPAAGNGLCGRRAGEPGIKHARCSVATRRRPEMLRGTSKMSMEGWWMVQTTVRPVLTVLRTVRITMAAALASRPLVGSSCTHSRVRTHGQHAHLMGCQSAATCSCASQGLQTLLGKGMCHAELPLRMVHPDSSTGMLRLHVPQVPCHDMWLAVPTMKMMEGLATSSTPMVRRLRCSTLSPLTPGTPTSALASGASSISSSTCSDQKHGRP